MAADLIFPEGTSDEMSFLFRNIEWPPLSAELKTDPGVLSIMAPDSQLSPPSHPCYIQLNSVTCSMRQGADALSHPFSGSLPLPTVPSFWNVFLQKLLLSKPHFSFKDQLQPHLLLETFLMCFHNSQLNRTPPHQLSGSVIFLLACICLYLHDEYFVCSLYSPHCSLRIGSTLVYSHLSVMLGMVSFTEGTQYICFQWSRDDSYVKKKMKLQE